ncbi:MAG: anion permease, partial [Candidatus Bathyarchaeia archaeon]
LTVIFIVIAPLLGMTIGFFFMSLILNVIVKTKRFGAGTSKLFGRLQLISSAIYSLGHGSNDAQKTAGIIAVLLFSTGFLSTFHVPFWVIVLSYTTIALGTLVGGWRVVRTMGMRITKLKTPHGFAAETTGGILLFGTALAGIPVSTTHTIAGSIIGVGATRSLSAVRWGVARRIVVAWAVTIPLTALVAGGIYLLFGAFGVI